MANSTLSRLCWKTNTPLICKENKPFLFISPYVCLYHRSEDSYNVIIMKVVIDFSYFFFLPCVLIMQTYKNKFKILLKDLSPFPASVSSSWMDNSIQMIVFCPPKPLNGAFVYRNVGKGPYHSSYSLFKRKQIFDNGWKVKVALLTTLKTMLPSA